MMYNYPYFSFPHIRRYPNYQPIQYPYMRQGTKLQEQQNIKTQQEQARQSQQISQNQRAQQRQNFINNPVEKGFSFLNNILHQEDRGDDEEHFDFLGLKLYNDDLLLMGLIFFLYKEDVKDQYLFFALILLLLS